MNVDLEKEQRLFLRQLEKLHGQIQDLSTTLKFSSHIILLLCRDRTMKPDMAKAANQMFGSVWIYFFRNEIIEKIRQLLTSPVPFGFAVPASLLEYFISSPILTFADGLTSKQTIILIYI